MQRGGAKTGKGTVLKGTAPCSEGYAQNKRRQQAINECPPDVEET